MDTRLLRHYESELAFLREMGAEFAQSYPKIAARLGMDGLEVHDPYVERLLEGAAFLAARVQLELDLQYPAFTSHLLDIVYPHFLAPTPSMMVVAFDADVANPALKDGHVMPRHTVVRSALPSGQATACTFRTAHDVTLWPLEVAAAEYVEGRGALVAAGVALLPEARAGIRLRLRRPGGLALAELPLDALRVFVGGQGARGWQLHELLCTGACGLVARSTDRRADWVMALDRGNVRAAGFDRAEALLPTPVPSFDGYRLLQEYFAMPDRFHFVDMDGLSGALARAQGSEVDIWIVLRHGHPDMAAHVSPEAFILNATPAINLFEKRCDRVPVLASETEHRVVPDRTAPMDYEVFSVDSVTGISGEGIEDTNFHPFYSADDFTAAGQRQPAYFAISRKMRQRTEREKLKGARTTYLGSESWLSLVDAGHAPFAGSIQQLAVRAHVTNRDLPLLLGTGSRGMFHLPGGGPVRGISVPVSPTRPRPTLAQGDAAWRLIGHLSLNYLSLADTTRGTGAEALRELVGLYAPPGDRGASKQLEGIVRLSSRPIVRRMHDEVLSTAIRGLEITLHLDDAFFEGTGVYVLGAVLERFFRRHVSINSFTETVLVSQQRGEIARWRPATGLGRTI
ncbi:MAG: type VI secretion system baseplate subunit TssF [Gemmobacter sp.]|nr:type VI secretion system baseplate subunit TssF [Gemmobacter sp.]